MSEKRNPLPELPEALHDLNDFVYNLWWSWHPEARDLFRSLDLQAWRDSDHNPIQMLSMLPPERFQWAADHDHFMARYHDVLRQYQEEVSTADGWFREECGDAKAPMAYFSAEYGLHTSLPVYAGGLGILAGDHLKECSDLSIPLVAVGMFYSEGYVLQRIREDGWQEDIEKPLDRTFDPITQLVDDNGNPLLVEVPVLQPTVKVMVWRVNVGRNSLFLLDPAIDVNKAWDQNIASHLYISNPEQRLRQEILLGMGGMRVLETLGIEPAAMHLNEGHAAFGALERVRQRVEDGMDFDGALDDVRRSTIFTTHTPVPAGTDIFHFELLDQYFGSYLRDLGVDRDHFFQLGRNPDDPQAGFNMTVFAMHMAGFRNAVSKRHGEVTRSMWSNLWPDTEEKDTPIEAITNGVHLTGWLEPTRLVPLLSDHLSDDWVKRQDEVDIWEAVDAIPNAALWDIHQELKSVMLAEIDGRARARWRDDQAAASNIIAFGALLDPEVLTIGFARRFTGYKRPTLIFRDLDRIRSLVTDPLRPLQIIFAGLAHPSDTEGKRLIQEIFRHAQDPNFAGRIAFVEDYDEELAQYMVHGADIWLNNPRPPQEASGTSGMKASINGVPNLSVLDGWWIEGYNGENGWAFGDEDAEGDERDAADANAIYQLLEDEILPMYYNRADGDVPTDFVKVMKNAIKSVAPRFGTRRMVKEYVQRFYAEALNGG